MPSSVPMISGIGVSSRRRTPGGMYGQKLSRYGLSGLNPTRSGYSIAAAASTGSMRSDISYWPPTSLAKRGECGIAGTLHVAAVSEQAEHKQAGGSKQTLQ